MFLTESEIIDLTGFRQPSKQVEHLKAQRIPFHTNRSGHPKVARAILEGAKAATEKATQKQSWSPSWAASPR